MEAETGSGQGMAVWQFWMVAAALMLAVLVVLGQALRRADVPMDASDTGVYRDQLAEIDRDVARGTLTADEAVRLRTEVARRLLDADRAGLAPSLTRHAPVTLTLLSVAIVLAASAWGYLRLGVPGYGDLPLVDRLAQADAAYLNRPTQAEMEQRQPAPTVVPDPELETLTARLREVLVNRPDDLQGLDYLIRNEVALGNYAAAHSAQVRRIAAKGAAVTADDHALLAELRIMAAGGLISAEAEAALVAALSLDPTNGSARYYSGLMFAQLGRPDRAFGLWRGLLADSPPNAPWVEPIRAQIETMAAAAGEAYTLQPLAGPSDADIAAAADMTPEERMAMVEGMVAQLSGRLASDGGPAADWARLITSLGVLDRADDARAILTEAQGRFADSPADLALLSEAAAQAGIAP